MRVLLADSRNWWTLRHPQRPRLCQQLCLWRGLQSPLQGEPSWLSWENYHTTLSDSGFDWTKRRGRSWLWTEVFCDMCKFDTLNFVLSEISIRQSFLGKTQLDSLGTVWIRTATCSSLISIYISTSNYSVISSFLSSAVSMAPSSVTSTSTCTAVPRYMTSHTTHFNPRSRPGSG